MAENRQRARALAAQTQHQAFQDRVLHEKFQADARDLETLQAWWPTFTSAEGESLKTLTVPPLKNAQMWNRISMEVQKKKQQAAASRFANRISTLNLADPADQATAWEAAADLPPEALDMLGRRIDHAVTAEQRRTEAQALADYRNRNLDIAERKLEMFESPEGPVQGVAVLNPDGSVNEDFFATQSASGRGWTVRRGKREAPTLSPSAEAGIIKSQISDLENELEDLPGAGTTGEKSRGTAPRRLEIQGKLDTLRKERDALRKPSAAPAASAPSAPTRVRVREKATGKLGWWEGGAVPAGYETVSE